ncbi:MAG: YIP1 family protein [Gammaproteobacteria bacterium]|nr:MAG: YIP1 family protein [Gammaproteobacteria bacterium]
MTDGYLNPSAFGQLLLDRVKMARKKTMDNTNSTTLNPWFSMWTRPRETIQQIVETNPTRLVFVLAAVGGISQTLDRASAQSAGDNLALMWILLLAIVLGPIAGIVMLFVGAKLFEISGKWLGGIADSVNLRAAIAWSNVPIIWAMLLWIPQFALLGGELFTSQTPRMDASDTLLFSYLSLAGIEVVAAVWSFVIFLKSIGQVQGFSAWKALANLAVVILMILVPIVLLLVVFGGSR